MTIEEVRRKRRDYMRNYRLRNAVKVAKWQAVSNDRRRAKPPTEKRRRYSRDKYKNDPVYRGRQLARTRRNHLKRRYGLTPESRDALFAKQRGRCAICKTDNAKTWHIDHCHRTNIVRGILCQLCNVSLGAAREDVRVLRGMIRYIKKYK